MKADDSFESEFRKQLTFLQLYNFFKYHKEYSFTKKVPYISCFCEICENCYLLVKALHKRIKKLLESFPINPHDNVENFSCKSQWKRLHDRLLANVIPINRQSLMKLLYQMKNYQRKRIIFSLRRVIRWF